MSVSWVSKGLVAATLLLVAACGEDELILEGIREPVRLNTIDDIIVNRVEPIALPDAQLNTEWTHTGGTPSHRIAHPVLRQPLTLAWSTPIGAGESKRQRLSADPVVASNRIFTFDSQALVSAIDLNGDVLWTRDLTPADERRGEGLGGGLAVTGGRLFVTTGFGRLAALDAGTGDLVWEQRIDAAVSGPPTVVGDIVYLSARNGTGWAINADTGRIAWDLVAGSAESGLLGGPAPVLAGDLMVFPFASGQMVAADRETGALRWFASVAGERANRVFSKFRDLTGDPVVVGETLIAGSHSGRTAAFDIDGGTRLWTAEEGAMSPVSVVSGAVFLVSDENRLVRLDLETGDIVWRVDLPFFTKERQSRRKSTFAHFGPVLAGGRLVVVSDDGFIRSFDPASGALISSQELPSGAAGNPVVAGGALYVVTENGRLNAFR